MLRGTLGGSSVDVQKKGIYPEFHASCPARHHRKMSSPLDGRALAFPAIWGTRQQHSVVTPQPIEGRPPSDVELMAGLQTKDAKSLDRIFSGYARLVFAIALRIVSDRSEAEDVVQ